MRYMFLLLFGMLLANTLLASQSQICKKCHPIIYEEYYKSSHRNASVYNNPVHKAMWEAHPKNEKRYTCAKCHSPSDTKALNSGKLERNDAQLNEPISCIYCHTIKDIKEQDPSNTNVTTGKNKEFYTAEKGKKGKAEYEIRSSWFGLVSEPKSSPYHKIDYDNENYYNGNVCMGCHSHTNNEHGFDISMLDAVIDKKDKNSCITCHMPQVIGTKVTINETKTHAYHGIAGIYHNSKKMGEYIDLKLSKDKEGFTITVVNRSNHALFGQAFREGVLKAEIRRGGEIIKLDSFIFERIFAKEGKEVMPWDANEVIKDTLIYAKREVKFKEVLQKGDKLTVTLGVRRISKAAAKNLGLENNKEVTKFKVLKNVIFDN